MAALAGGWVLFNYPPATTPWYPQCVFHALTGLDCPGCGITRALHHLLHGRIGEAFALNPMIFVFLAVLLAALPALLRREAPRFTTRPWFGWTSLAVISVWWIGRNL